MIPHLRRLRRGGGPGDDGLGGAGGKSNIDDVALRDSSLPCLLRSAFGSRDPITRGFDMT